MTKQFTESLNKILDRGNLDFDEAQSVMNEIMDGEVSPVNLAAWLAAMRTKGETAAEIAGCAAAMRDHSLKVDTVGIDAVDIVGTGGDGAHSVNVSTTAAVAAAAAGVPVAKHGGRASSSKSGSADILESLGVSTKMSPEQAGECLRAAGITYMFAPNFHPAMKHAMPVRRELAVRTIFNILGPLCNPASVKRMVLGVYSADLLDTMAEALVELGMERAMVVHGAGGMDELSLAGENNIRDIRGGKIAADTLAAPELGLETAPVSAISGGTPDENAETLRATLSGSLSGPKLDVVLLNAAAGVIVGGLTEDWRDAIEIVRETIADGAAISTLEKLARQSNA